MGRDLDAESPSPKRRGRRQGGRRQPDRGGDLCLLAVFLTTAALIGRMRRGQRLAE